MKQISKLDSQQLRSKRPVLLEFYSNQKLLYVIWVKLKSFSEDFFFFCERSVCEKVQLFKILKRRYFLLGSCIDTIFGLPWNKKNCFGSLINHGTILWTGITCKNILFLSFHSTCFWNTVPLVRNKKQKYFLLPDYQLVENLILSSGFKKEQRRN